MGRGAVLEIPVYVAVTLKFGLEFPELNDYTQVQLEHDFGHVG